MFPVTPIGTPPALPVNNPELLRLLLNNMPNSAVIIFDMQMRFTLAGGPFLLRVGFTAEQILGKKPQDIFPPEASAFLIPIYQRALNGENFTYDRSTPNYSYQAYVSPLRDDAGQIVGGIVLSHDTTVIQRAEEPRFHSMVDLAPVGIIQTDLNGKRVFCNSSWCELTGISLEDALSDVHFETVYPEDLPISNDAWHTMMRTNKPINNAEFRYLRPDGSTVWVSGNGRPVYDAQGIVTGYLGTTTDITERKLLEEALINRETRFRTLVEFAPVGIAEMDITGRVLLRNSRLQQLSGISDKDALNDKLQYEAIHPDDRLRLTTELNATIKEGRASKDIEFRYLHRDGKVVWVSSSMDPIISETGEVEGYITVNNDITELKRLENALRTNEERLRLITDNIQDLVTQGDVNNHITYASPSYTTLLGYNPASLLGKPLSNIIHPDDLILYTNARQTALENQTGKYAVQSRFRNAQGNYISVESLSTILFDDQHHYAGWVHVARDITERQRVQALLLETEKLQTAFDKEHELSDLKSRMMERIAHEFRTPLTVIQITTDTLTHYLDRLTPEQKATKVTTIQRTNQRLTDMLDQIGMVINGGFSPAKLDRQPTNITALFQASVHELEDQYVLTHKFVLDMPTNMVCLVDPLVLKNAILHLLRNAARYSSADAVVTVTGMLVENGIDFRITDTGIGIPLAEQLRIFDPFFRGSNINEIGGLGLGLTIAHGAIQAHNGTITVESVLNHGTTVTIHLP